LTLAMMRDAKPPLLAELPGEGQIITEASG
jgi:hypothetical protein